MFMLGTIRLGLWLFPFRLMRLLLAGVKQSKYELHEPDETYIDKTIWAITIATEYIPATCLTQAIAIQVLLAQRSYSTDLRIGVAKCDGRQLQAHAWVESQGKVVIGASEDLSRYTPLPPLQGWPL